MVQQSIAADLGPVHLQPTLSDRPWAYRATVHSLHFFVHKPLGGVGVAIIVLVLCAAIFAPLVQRYDPERAFVADKPDCTPAQAAEDPPVTNCLDRDLLAKAQVDSTLRLTIKDPNRILTGQRVLFGEGPSGAHWLGTDSAGRDLYSRIINGSRLALVIGLGASLVAVIVGTVFGLVSAYFSGVIDMVIQRIADAFQAFPPFILLLLFTQVVERPNMYFLAFALGIVGIAQVIRIVRSSVLATREEVYITAARTVGAGDFRIMYRHILPNIFAVLIVVFTSAIGAYILAEAGLAFIGLGDLSAISWGKMVEEGRRQGIANPSMAFFVGMALTITVLGFNLAGDALRDVLDPRLRGRGGRPGFTGR